MTYFDYLIRQIYDSSLLTIILLIFYTILPLQSQINWSIAYILYLGLVHLFGAALVKWYSQKDEYLIGD